MSFSPEKKIQSNTNKEEKRNRLLKKGAVASVLAALALAGSPEEAKANNTPIFPMPESVSLGLSKKVVEEVSQETKPRRSDEAHLAQQILENKNISFWENDGADTETVVEDLAHDRPAELTCGSMAGQTSEVDKGILQFILKVANDGDYIMVNALTDKCHSEGSNHYEGRAVDLDCTTVASFEELEQDAREFNGINNGEYCGPSSHYHFDFK